MYFISLSGHGFKDAISVRIGHSVAGSLLRLQTKQANQRIFLTKIHVIMPCDWEQRKLSDPLVFGAQL